MHVGNLRTALYAYLIAKHEGGDFILRIEDTDQKREMEGAVEIIKHTMQETGLIPDESPELGGPVGPYVQSERVKSGLYMKYAKMLVEKGEAYYCFCTQERLDSLKQVVDGKEISVYDKHCLHLSKEEVEANLAAGKPFVIRQNNPLEGTTTFHDELYGDITVENKELDDMILIKSDGYPTYNFANVVDDHLMGITHVVRGNEYISSSPKYNRLYDAFGWEVPKYIHCPLITDADHKKLSKRSGYSSYEDLIEQGFLPEAVVNFIALLGWSPENDNEIFSLDELVKVFDYHRIGKSPAVFDYTKLRWMNGEYLRRMDPEKFYEKALPYLRKVIHKDNLDLKTIAELVRTRIEIFPDMEEMVSFFEELPSSPRKNLQTTRSLRLSRRMPKRTVSRTRPSSGLSVSQFPEEKSPLQALRRSWRFLVRRNLCSESGKPFLFLALNICHLSGDPSCAPRSRGRRSSRQ